MCDKNGVKVDVFMFAGQSNMAGRGDHTSATECPEYAGMEYRAISDKTKLYPVTEPFGVNENNPDGINEPEKKKGSMVSAFIKSYYEETGRQVIAISASQGGVSSGEWADFLVNDASLRLQSALEFLKREQYCVENVVFVWCQGETDSDEKVSGQDYIDNFNRIWKKMKIFGAKKCLMIQTGHYNYILNTLKTGEDEALERESGYEVIRDAQQKICDESDDVEMIATFADYLDMMKDSFHYYQKAYNEIGEQAGKNAARVLNGNQQID